MEKNAVEYTLFLLCAKTDTKMHVINVIIRTTMAFLSNYSDLLGNSATKVLTRASKSCKLKVVDVHAYYTTLL